MLLLLFSSFKVAIFVVVVVVQFFNDCVGWLPQKFSSLLVNGMLNMYVHRIVISE